MFTGFWDPSSFSGPARFVRNSAPVRPIWAR